MIEFKADCGHTVRAKDEDAGKVVRCAYCGREAQVPEDDGGADDLDFLFAGIDDDGSDGAKDSKGGRKSSKRGKASPFGRRSGQGKAVDPFAVVTKMAYVAVVLIIVIFVGKKYVWPMASEALFARSDTTQQEDLPSKPVVNKPRRRPLRPAPPGKTLGLIQPRLDVRGGQGLYVNAVPPRVDVYYREAAKAGKAYSWMDEPSANRILPPGYTHDLSPGVYEVVVMLPVNDRQLKRRYSQFGYHAFREVAEREVGKSRADQVAREFFRPDGATDVKVVRLRERINLVRQYSVTIRNGEWEVLTPLFIPFACSMEDIVSMVPKDVSKFAFDVDDITDELSYYGVSPVDSTYVVAILERIGSISYHEVPQGGRKDGKYPFRIFRISPADGVFTAWPIAGVERKPVKRP